MEWILKKGQDLAAQAESHGSMGFHQFFWSGQARKASLDLLASGVDKAPFRSKDRVRCHSL